ncbi:hypothetical protein VNO80_06126 [Phaseolus coccineus]|uniref:RIN4 pathogenic type III effector avirulence factor Avr cleavage site domain-containing protein n=1 Tax=Phaseolus coccineus TaxID=3886 RepID=A0AAN9RIF6_PHACN
MERNEKNAAMISVPKFGGWDQEAPGATNYSMVFTQVRQNKKHKKTSLSKIKRKSLGNEGELANAKHGQAPYHHAYAHEDLLRKKRIITYINCCIRPTIAIP